MLRAGLRLSAVSYRFLSHTTPPSARSSARFLLQAPTMVTSTRAGAAGQSKLDGYVKGGSSKKKNKNESGETAENSVESTTSSSKTKRPRPDGTDVPPEAKKPKANGQAAGTHKAFPANPPEPNEIQDGVTVLGKFKEVYGQQKEIKVSGSLGGRRQKVRKGLPG